MRDNELRGAFVDPRTTGPRWERERDIPADVYFPALEALRAEAHVG